MLWSDIEGNERAIQSLQRALAAGRPSHAYLLVGPPGSGKGALALAYATAANCDGGGTSDTCGSCRSCRLAAAGNHPAISITRPSGAYIKLKQVQDLLRDMALAPPPGLHRVYILVDAERLTPEAANALLKSLEEPAAATTVVLLTTAPQAILPTVTSRCQTLRLGRVDVEAVARHIERRRQAAAATGNPASPDAGLLPSRVLARLCDGAPGRAEELDGVAGLAEVRREAYRVLARPEARPPHELLELADRLAATPAQVLPFLDLLQALARDIVVFQLAGRSERLINDDAAVGLDRLRDDDRARDPVDAARVVSLCEQTKQAIHRHANVRLALEALLVQL